MSETIYRGDAKAIAHTLPNALHIFGEAKRDQLLDSLHCFLHNEGHSLKGNTEEFDAEWLARLIYSRRHHSHPNRIDEAPDQVRQEYKEIAHIAIEALPQLCERIAQRYINAAAAVETFNELRRASERHGGAS